MTLLWALLGGFAGRIRGGLLDAWAGRMLGKPAFDPITGEPYGLPNAIIRSAWALCVTALICTKGDYLWISPLIFVFAFLGVCSGYLGGKFGLNNPDNRNWRNYALLTASGMATIFQLAVLMTIWGEPSIWFGVVAGALFVPCYLAGNVIYKYWKIQGPTQFGEWLLYSAIMGAMAWK